jgi:hypothetical protein
MPVSQAAQPGPGGAPTGPLVPLSDITTVRRCSDPSLPEGAALWLGLHSDPQGIYLVADSEEAAESWTDCILLASYVVQTQGEEAMGEALSPAHQ